MATKKATKPPKKVAPKAKAVKKPVAKAKPTPKKVTKPVAKKVVAKSVKPTAKPVKKVTKPVAKKVVKLIKKADKPVAKKIVAKKVVKKVIAKKPIAKKTVKPVLAKKVNVTPKKVAKPAPKAKVAPKKVAKVVAKPTKKAVAKVVKKTVKPEIKKVVKAITKPAEKKSVKPTSKPKSKPVAKKIVKPIAKPIAKKVVKPVAKPVAKPAAKVVQKPVEKVKLPIAATIQVDAKAVKTAPETSKTEVEKPKVAATVAAPVAKNEIVEKTKTLSDKPASITNPVVKPSVKEKMIDLRYSDKDLQEFEVLINEKLKQAKVDMEELRQSLSHDTDNSTDDTSPTFKMMEDGSETMSREELAQLASRQEKFLINLDNALLRIKNKTYGICRVTGTLIPKERLRLVPHATLSIEAKNMQ